MQVEFLGTGGAVTTPRPLCDCRVCVQARELGIPYARSGPSVFVHGPDVLIDTPEEIKAQLDRSRVGDIAACFYSHWHGDHVLGWRVWEALNKDFRGWPPEERTTEIYLPEQVAIAFRKMLGMRSSLAFFENLGIVEVVEMVDGEVVTLGGTTIHPLRLAEEFVYAFEFERDGTRLLIAPDEVNGWKPPGHLRGADLAVLQVGVFEFDPLTRERRIHEENPVLQSESTFEQTLEIVEKLDARRTILTHVEEMDGLSHDDLQKIGNRLQDQGRNIEFAYDTLIVDV